MKVRILQGCFCKPLNRDVSPGEVIETDAISVSSNLVVAAMRAGLCEVLLPDEDDIPDIGYPDSFDRRKKKNAPDSIIREHQIHS